MMITDLFCYPAVSCLKPDINCGLPAVLANRWIELIQFMASVTFFVLMLSFFNEAGLKSLQTADFYRFYP
ncbi:MAG: hypothetical protein R6T91_06680 [Bacteroidales bacterium]